MCGVGVVCLISDNIRPGWEAFALAAERMSADKKSGTKLFAVSGYKSLNRKQSYVIALDFKKATVNFHKVKGGKEVKKIFPFTQCVKLEKDKKDTKMLSLTFGNYTDAAYKKTIYFDCQEDRGSWCSTTCHDTPRHDTTRCTDF